MGGKRVAIYGAGQAGTQLASAFAHTDEYKTVAFIDDKVELKGAVIAGVKVYPSTDLAKLLIDKNIQIVILAIPTLNKSEQKKILDILEPLKIKIKISGSIKNMVSAGQDAPSSEIREIEIEDLLGRDPVAPDPFLISSCIAGKAILVTGAGGSIGSELCRQILAQKPKKLILLEMTEYALYKIEQELTKSQIGLNLNIEIVPFLGNVTDEEKCYKIIKTYAIDTVYHAAAYKHVPLVEHNPIEGIRNNILGTLNLAKAAANAGVRDFILISTDKAVRPTNVMGATKRFSELILQALSRVENYKRTKFSMVRFGNVLGSSGSVVPLFRKQIAEGGPITITHPEITRYFMTIPEAAQLVLQAGAMSNGGDVFVLDMGEPVKIIDLAKHMVHLSGLELKSEDAVEGTIEIRHVGLRPGEKLYEELLIGDNVEGTSHPLIMRAQETYFEWEVLQHYLANLFAACDEASHLEIRKLLLSAIQGYAPMGDIEDFIWRNADINEQN